MTGTFIISERPRADRNNERGNTYFWHAKRSATSALESDGLPVVRTGPIHISIGLIYPQPGAMLEHDVRDIGLWGEHGIPRPERAAALILDALTGSLYSSVSQVEPLHVSRIILPAPKILEQFGPDNTRGCTVIRWSCE